MRDWRRASFPSVADGTSCRHQILDGAERAALHVGRALEMSLQAGVG